MDGIEAPTDIKRIAEIRTYAMYVIAKHKIPKFSRIIYGGLSSSSSHPSQILLFAVFYLKFIYLRSSMHSPT